MLLMWRVWVVYGVVAAMKQRGVWGALEAGSGAAMEAQRGGVVGVV